MSVSPAMLQKISRRIIPVNGEVMFKGKSFHIHAPATGKARRPTVESGDVYR